MNVATKLIHERHFDDFINSYIDYADVIEAPRKAHQAIAINLLATAMNRNVYIQHGALKISLDQWILLLSRSGLGRNTLIDLARPVIENAGLSNILRNTSWGSKSAFFQDIADDPHGLFLWPEIAVVLKIFADPRFGGAKEWLTDRYDNFNLPASIGYRITGKQSDTPPIVFSQAPRLNICATSSADWFVSNLAQEDTTGGFVPRWLIVNLEDPGRLISKPQKPDQALIKPLAGHLKSATQLKGIADLTGVEAEYDDWYREAHHRFINQPNRSLAMPFFNRLRTHVLKLAVIFEVSRSLKLRVSNASMKRAIDTAFKVEQTIFELLPTGMNREGSEVDRMADRVKAAGREGLSRSDLTRAFQYIKSNEREGRLRTLVDAEVVFPFNRPTSGRTRLVLVHNDFLQEHEREFPNDIETVLWGHGFSHILHHPSDDLVKEV